MAYRGTQQWHNTRHKAHACQSPNLQAMAHSRHMLLLWGCCLSDVVQQQMCISHISTNSLRQSAHARMTEWLTVLLMGAECCMVQTPLMCPPYHTTPVHALVRLPMNYWFMHCSGVATQVCSYTSGTYCCIVWSIHHWPVCHHYVRDSTCTTVVLWPWLLLAYMVIDTWSSLPPNTLPLLALWTDVVLVLGCVHCWLLMRCCMCSCHPI